MRRRVYPAPPRPPGHALPVTPTLRHWRSEQRSFSSGKPSRSVSRPHRSPLPAQPTAHCAGEAVLMSTHARSPGPRLHDLCARAHSPRTTSSRRAPGHSPLSHGTGWVTRPGRSAALAAGSLTSGHPRSRAGRGRTGRIPVRRRGPSTGHAPAPHPRRSHRPFPAFLTRVLTHKEFGTQLCCPVSHSLISVQAWRTETRSDNTFHLDHVSLLPESPP